MPTSSTRPNPRASAARRLVVAAASPSERWWPPSWSPGAFFGSRARRRPGRRLQEGLRRAGEEHRARPGVRREPTRSTCPTVRTSTRTASSTTGTGTTTTTRRPRTPSPAPRRPPTPRRPTRRPRSRPGSRPTTRRSSATRPSRRSPTCRSAPPTRASPTNRYNMFNACYGLQSTTTGRWLTDTNVPTFAAGVGERRHPALLQADRAGSLPALQPRAPLPRRRRRHRDVRRRRRTEQRLGRRRCPRPASSPSRSPARAT